MTDEGTAGALAPLDLAIFRELQQDGRLPFATLAERVGGSEAHVRRRVKALADADVLAITAVADPRVLGLEQMAWIGLRVHQSATDDVARTLMELPAVDYIVISSGRFNVMAEVACASASALYGLLREIRAIPGVQRTESFVYLDFVKQHFQWSRGGAGVRGRGIGLERLDADIIRELQVDGRASFRDIARRLGVSERVVSARFAQLVDRRVVRVIAVGNPLTMGLGALAWLGIQLREGVDLERAAAALADVGRLSYVVVTAGSYDIMAEVVCRDRDDLLATLSGEIGAIDGLGHVDTFFYLRLLYRSTAGAWGAGRTLAIQPVPAARAS